MSAEGYQNSANGGKFWFDVAISLCAMHLVSKKRVTKHFKECSCFGMFKFHIKLNVKD